MFVVFVFECVLYRGQERCWLFHLLCLIRPVSWSYKLRRSRTASDFLHISTLWSSGFCIILLHWLVFLRLTSCLHSLLCWFGRTVLILRWLNKYLKTNTWKYNWYVFWLPAMAFLTEFLLFKVCWDLFVYMCLYSHCGKRLQCVWVQVKQRVPVSFSKITCK